MRRWPCGNIGMGKKPLSTAWLSSEPRAWHATPRDRLLLTQSFRDAAVSAFTRVRQRVYALMGAPRNDAGGFLSGLLVLHRCELRVRDTSE